MGPYPVFEIGWDAAEAIESLGTKRKFWYNRGRWLFKAVHSTGEDWAEKVCAEIAGRIGLPHAEYDLAVWRSADEMVLGVRSKNFSPDDAILILGNELLAEAYPDYAAGVSRFRQSTHTVERVVHTLHRYQPSVPLEWEAPNWLEDSLDVF